VGRLFQFVGFTAQLSELAAAAPESDVRACFDFLRAAAGRTHDWPEHPTALASEQVSGPRLAHARGGRRAKSLIRGDNPSSTWTVTTKRCATWPPPCSSAAAGGSLSSNIPAWSLPTIAWNEVCALSAVQWRKIVFGNRSTEGEVTTARLLTLTQTCQMQGRHALGHLTEAILRYRRHQPAPSCSLSRRSPREVSSASVCRP
jgi:hypothetical protein